MIKRIMAILHKQEWVGDLAVEVGEPIAFDVTDRILAMGKDSALALKDDDYDTDYLATELGLLDDHAGPFYVEVKESIRDFFMGNTNKLKENQDVLD